MVGSIFLFFLLPFLGCLGTSSGVPFKKVFVYKGSLNWKMEVASEKGDICFVRELISRGANDFDRAMGRGAKGGHQEIVKLMLEMGATDYNRSMWAASTAGHIEIVEMMLERGANDYNDSLEWAAKEGNLKIVELLLEKGADEFNRAIEWAVRRRHKDIQRLIISAYGREIKKELLPCNVKEELRAIEKNIRYPSSKYGFENDFLLSEVDKGRIKSDRVPFSHLPRELISIIFAFVGVGSQLELIFLYSNRDLDQEELNSVEAEEWSKYLPLNRKDENGLTMLHKVCYYGHRNKVSFLLSKGVLKNMEDEERKRPLWYAKEGAKDQGYFENSEFREWLNYLENAGLK